MKKFLTLISDGIRSIADAYVAPHEYVKLPPNGFEADNANLRSDVARVGEVMESVIGRGKPRKRTGRK